MAQNPNNQQQQVQRQPVQQPNRNSAANIFRSIFTPKAAQSQQAQQQPQKLGPDGKPLQSNNDTGIETANQDNNDQKNAKSPFDDFTKIFENASNDGTKNAPPSLSLSPDKLKEHVDKMDFLSSLSQDDQQALLGMGEQGKVISQLLNHVGRQAYQNALHHSSVLIDRGVTARSEYDGQNLDNRIKGSLAKNAFNKPDAHPVVRQVQSMFSEMILQANPDATADEIAQQTNSFFTMLGDAIKGNQENADGRAEADEVQDVNWLEFAGHKTAESNQRQ